MSRPSSPLSCATSDTASVALEDFVPELEEFDDIVLPALAARRNPHSHKHTTRSSPRDLKARLPNGSAQHSSKSRARVSEGSSATKAVEADPTAGRASCTLPEPTIGLRGTARAKQVEKRKKSSFTFVSNDEAKSVFERERGSTDGSGVSAGDADRNKFGDYWKELETVSIRRSMEAKPGARNGGQQRMRQEGSKAPSLDPQNRGSSSRRGSKQSKSKKNGMEIEREEDRHPITEENIDGGDAIGVDVKRKRKAMKRARSTQESLRRSRTKQRSQWHSSNGHDADMVDARNREGEESMKVAGAGIGLQNGLDDGEDTGRSTGFSESDGQACMQCGGHGKASKMVLCDVCSDGCHTFCMRPARASVPLGVWICPRCHTVAKKHRVHLSKLGGFLKSNAVAGE